jgi:protein-S-isoprenylcysteine O-methyltransferase Ste14
MVVRDKIVMLTDLRHEFYELNRASTAQRLTLASVLLISTIVFWWLLFGGGLESPGDPARRVLLFACWSIYCVRLLFTEWVFLRRGINWKEIFMIGPWILLIALAYSILGGRNADLIGPIEILGAVLYAAGSFINSYSEYRRHVWKQRPENRGRVYTEGLFRYAVHINYFGDVVLFTGFSLLTGSPYTLVIPALMLAGFVFANIPVLDAHLHDKYGAAFDAYRAKTKKLIPLVY